jgi:site-specific DNA recombinase
MRCEMGLWPAPAPTGYLNEKRIDRKGYVIVDVGRAPVVRQMFEKMAYEKWSGQKLYHWLKFDMNFRSATSNKPLSLSNIYKILQTPFYFGQYEFPLGSGKWYTGKHEPIITRDLYEKTQAQLKRDRIVRGESKEFAFTRLITCGACGSGVCAEEKHKLIKSTGTTATYVYYGCNRSKDRACKAAGYIREEELIRQLIERIDKLELNEPIIRKKFEEERTRAKKFQRMFLGQQTPKYTEENFDARHYVRHVLTEGDVLEKRELLASLRTKVTLKAKRVFLEK